MNNVDSRPEAFTGPLAENPLVVELLGLLAKNNSAEQYADFSKLVSCVGAIEEQLNRTVTELSAVKKELHQASEGLTHRRRPLVMPAKAGIHVLPSCSKHSRGCRPSPA